MTDADTASTDRERTAAENSARRADRLEVAIATLLGLAAILTAFAAYKGDLANGDSLKAFQEANRTVSDANTFYTQGNQTSAQDSALFAEYAKANFADQTDLATYLETLMRPELVKAIRWWEDPENEDEAGPTPFGEENPEYFIADYAEAEDLTKKTDRLFKLAADEDERGDQYTLITVILASGLFMLGIAGVARVKRIKLATVSIGAIVMIVAGVMLLSI